MRPDAKGENEVSTTNHTPKIKVKLGLHVWTQRGDGFFHVYASPVTIGPNAWEQKCRATGEYAYPDIKDDTVRNCPGRGDVMGGLRLEDLRVRSQGNESDRSRSLYGWEVIGHDVYTVDLPKAEALVKTLRTIHARMTRLDEKLGRPTTYGAYLARVAAAIGAETFLTSDKTNTWHDDADYHFHAIADGVRYVDRLIAKWVNPPAADVPTAPPLAIHVA
jgi:hypothetical protein